MPSIDFYLIRKSLRYLRLYGSLRTLAKTLGRVRPKFKIWLILKFPFYKSNGSRVSIIGSGHHAFSSIAFFLSTNSDSKISFVSDINTEASRSLAFAYGAVDVGDDYVAALERDTKLELVYIASNHASHAFYAIEAIKRGLDVFIEKPIAVNRQQFDELVNTVDTSSSRVYVGYNRPFAPATYRLRELAKEHCGPLSLTFFVIAHTLPMDHWYRKPEEGSRIVANMSHWIDMTTHILHWKETLPDFVDIHIAYSNPRIPSDNIAITLTSSEEDIVSIVFSSRSEPFEGVNESLNFQRGKLSAKIDDFRTMQIWNDSHFQTYKFSPKDNGHKSCVLQPFNRSYERNWDEIKISTGLMLHIEEMVSELKKESRFFLNKKSL